MPNNEQVNFIFRVNDDQTLAKDMLLNQLSISEYSDDFSNAIMASAITFEQTNKVWLLSFNTAILQIGKTYFMRYTINDGDNPTNTTYPNNQTSFAYKNIWSFTVQ